MMKKTFIVLLSMLALMTSCRGGSLPEQKLGKVSLTFNSTVTRDSNNARTILPSEGDIGDFSVFELVFNPTSGGSPATIYMNKGNPPSDSFMLEVGTYELTATGYLDGTFNGRDTAPTSMARPAGRAVQSVSVSMSTPLPVIVTLRAINDGTGTFSWTLTNRLCLGITTTGNTMTITGLNGTAAPSPAISPFSWTGSRSLDAGYYNVTFHLETPPPLNNSLDFGYVLHIYQNWDSSFVYTVTDSMADLPDNVIVTGGGEGGIFSGITGLIPGHNDDDSSFITDTEMTVLFPHGIVYHPDGNIPIEETHVEDNGNSGGRGTMRISPITSPFWITVVYSSNVECRVSVLASLDSGGVGTLIGSQPASAPTETVSFTAGPYSGADNCAVITFSGNGLVQIYDIIIVSVRP